MSELDPKTPETKTKQPEYKKPKVTTNSPQETQKTQEKTSKAIGSVIQPPSDKDSTDKSLTSEQRKELIEELIVKIGYPQKDINYNDDGSLSNDHLLEMKDFYLTSTPEMTTLLESFFINEKELHILQDLKLPSLYESFKALTVDKTTETIIKTDIIEKELEALKALNPTLYEKISDIFSIIQCKTNLDKAMKLYRELSLSKDEK